jgi:MSHA pilin protein MshA
MYKRKKQQGFTLIELVVVIVILGILAVTAAPKFIDISSDAKKARHDALSGSIKSAANLAFSKCLVSSSCSQSGDSTIDIGGVTVEMLNGWPRADEDTGIGLLIDQDFAVEVRSEGAANGGAYTSWLISWPDKKGLWWKQDCTVTYSNYGSIDPQVNASTAFSDVCEN